MLPSHGLAFQAASVNSAVFNSFWAEALFVASFLTRFLDFLQNLTCIDPDFDADLAVGGVRLSKPVVDIGTQGLQQDSSFVIMLGPGDFSTANAIRKPEP